MKALISIITCNRIGELKKNIIPYMNFAAVNKEYSFVVSLDGCNKEYLDFCNSESIPLIWSDEREGAGLARNRILKLFPEYDYYFFVDDDVELYDLKIFNEIINIHLKTGYHHFSVNHTIGIVKKEKVEKHKITHTLFGGGYFLFYTAESLKTVGGWHTNFIKYKRYGHTEHTYRVYYSKLNPNPFIFSKQFSKMLILNNPVHVSTDENKHNINGLVFEEQNMIDNGQKYFPLTTVSNIYYNNINPNISESKKWIIKPRYEFIIGIDKKHAKSVLYFHKFIYTKNIFYLFASLLYHRDLRKIKTYIYIKIKTFLYSSFHK